MTKAQPKIFWKLNKGIDNTNNSTANVETNIEKHKLSSEKYLKVILFFIKKKQKKEE